MLPTAARSRGRHDRLGRANIHHAASCTGLTALPGSTASGATDRFHDCDLSAVFTAVPAFAGEPVLMARALRFLFGFALLLIPGDRIAVWLHGQAIVLCQSIPPLPRGRSKCAR
jgi:hypothetical protein